MKANGGDAECYRQAVITETSELFDCTVRQLYQGTDGKRFRRETLPLEVQQAYILNETLAAYELESMEGTIGGDDQEEVNDKINALVKDRSKKTRKWLPW